MSKLSVCLAQPGNQRSRVKLWEGATSIGLLFLRPALARPTRVFTRTPDLGSSPSSVLTPGQLQTQLGRQAWQPAPGRQGGYLQTGSTSAVTRGLGPCLSPGSLFLPSCARPFRGSPGPVSSQASPELPLPAAASARGSQSPELSTGNPELRSSSRGLCVGRRLLCPKKLRAGLLAPHLCLLAEAVHPVFRGD